MPITKSKKNYRKRVVESDNDEDSVNEGTAENISETIEDLQELRRLRRKHGGVDAEKLLKGSDKKKKKKAQDDSPDPWKLRTGGFVDKDAIRAARNDEEVPEKKLKLDTFTTQTNALDVDKHMMAYIEQEMRKRRGELTKEEEDAIAQARSKGPLDMYEELYKIPDRLKPVEEGSVQLSSQMLTAIPEVDLGIDVRLRNIEDTERAKRKLLEKEELEGTPAKSEEDDEVPANFEKQIVNPHERKEYWRQTATDEAVAERFKKRMRK
ncbi:hepatocellular carcinoma-associated antigen 59-domain-containing protein [Syncephalastrum racemosum]|uniref:Hepatocellular carcinoma-associated antigen 59-domain-containing protein n=1 Tax=Syncephalastrum racemosum TaxID=13706 RepID=A0A1X2HEM4_SYNRA|nr:hepatocellular carcinoma-associated antigen 59-domain-containing protein [Syncephalastrum racemosum]